MAVEKKKEKVQQKATFMQMHNSAIRCEVAFDNAFRRDVFSGNAKFIGMFDKFKSKRKVKNLYLVICPYSKLVVLNGFLQFNFY